jgi:hypothetical protein
LASIALLCCGSSPAPAQLNVPLQAPQLPQLPQLPSLPGPNNLPGLGATLNAAQETAATARRTAIQTLIRRNPQQLEADPNGEPAVRAQIVGVNVPADALQRIAAAGFTLISRQALMDSDLEMIVLGVPARSRTARALAQLRALAPGVSFDYNHVYLGSGDADGAAPLSPVGPTPPAALAVPARTAETASPTPTDTPRVGLVDGGVDTHHLVFAHAQIRHFGCEDREISSAHGTAVASLLVGQAANFDSAAAGATLYAADVYCGLATGGSVDAIARAFGWLTDNRVPVINVSLVGAGNLVLQQLVKTLLARGFLIVAAVGNDGPAAPPLYPAAYPGVVGVTGVDAHRRVLVEAGRGPQVMFAAPGADMLAASPKGFSAVRGTSFASPIVAAMLAARLPRPDTAAAHDALEALARDAVDLGPHGVDTTYGRGLVGEAWRMPRAVGDSR